MARTPRPAPKKAQPGLYDRQAETRRQKRGTPYDQAQERPQGSLPTASPSAAGHGAAERPMRPVSAGDEQVFPTRHTPSAAPPLPGENRQPAAPAPGRGRRTAILPTCAAAAAANADAARRGRPGPAAA